MNLKAHIRIPVQRCCPAHPDWRTLARHLVAEFADVPTREIVEELRQAKRAGEFFDLSAADALDCAELMMRYRVLSGRQDGDARSAHCRTYQPSSALCWSSVASAWSGGTKSQEDA